MKKAIVTGSTGFIGAVFVHYLINKNIDVLATGRKDLSSIGIERLKKLNRANYIKLEMSKIHELNREIKNINWDVGDDCVFFNLAWGGESLLSDLNEGAQLKNAAWSVKALETAKLLGCTRFIQIGTMEEAFTDKYLDLDYNISNKYNRHVIYSVAKIAAKNALKIKSDQIGMDLIYVYHSHVMGPDDDKDSFLQVTLQKLISGSDLIFSTGEQYFDVISLIDCSLGYYLIGEKGKSGSDYWVGSGDPRQLRDYVERMYALYPSNKKMEFGKFFYDDIILDKNSFSIENLVKDTDYTPTMSYEQAVHQLHEYLIKIT
jgi:nucleoside-diphosphate-sugar epimerase